MIVTVTANPSIDRTIELAAPLRRGEVQVVAGMREQAGGKGVNVARALHAADVDVLAVVPCDAADPLLAEIAGLGVSVSNVPTGAPVRTNITLSEPDGTTTKINEPGPVLSAEQVADATARLVEASRGAAWVALSGSLPPGAPVDWYARLVAALKPLGCRVAVDTSDDALEAVLAGLPSGSFDLIATEDPPQRDP